MPRHTKEGCKVYEMDWSHNGQPPGWSTRFVEAESQELALEMGLADIYEYHTNEELEAMEEPTLFRVLVHDSWNELEHKRGVVPPKSSAPPIRGPKRHSGLEAALDFLEDLGI